MTREEFIKKAEERYILKINAKGNYRGMYSNRELIEKNYGKTSEIKDMSSIEKITAFLDEFSVIGLLKIRHDHKDHVIKEINVAPMDEGEWCGCWSDIGEIVVRVAKMHNTSRIANDLFMSASGAFYDDGHNKVADDIDSFLEYFLEVPCDEHPQPDEQTYELLKNAGWYYDRKGYIKELILDCRKNYGVEFSEKQKDFISEFVDIDAGKFKIFDTANYHYFDRCKLGGMYPADCLYIGLMSIPGNVLKLFLSEEGRIYIEPSEPLGLDALEAIHIMLRYEYRNGRFFMNGDK